LRICGHAAEHSVVNSFGIIDIIVASEISISDSLQGGHTLVGIEFIVEDSRAHADIFNDRATHWVATIFVAMNLILVNVLAKSLR